MYTRVHVHTRLALMRTRRTVRQFTALPFTDTLYTGQDAY